MVGKTHLIDFIAHEVPLPLFGLGYDWACIFRGAPLPLGGKHELQSSLKCEASPPYIRPLAMTGQTFL